MRWSSSLLCLIAGVSAVPTTPYADAAPPADEAVYVVKVPPLFRLRVTHPVGPLDGEYLSARNGKVGVFINSTRALVVYPFGLNMEDGETQLHTFPVYPLNKTSNYVLALSGPERHQELVAVPNPTILAKQAPPYQTSFKIDGTDGSLSTSGVHWRAFPREHGWIVGRDEGKGAFTAMYQYINITLEALGDKDFSSLKGEVARVS